MKEKVMQSLRFRDAASRLIVVAALVAASGCEWQSAPPARTTAAVAVIDLDAIAHRLGTDQQIADSITQRQTALKQQLVDLAKNYNAQIAEKQKTLPAAQAQQNDVTLASWQQQATASLNQAKQRADVDLKSHKQQLINQFRDQIKPAARRVAHERGLSVIVTKNDSVVFDYTGAADITEAVVNELLAGRPAAATAAAPATPAR
jgi:Skp family chaperone for outer membrane proteins